MTPRQTDVQQRPEAIEDLSVLIVDDSPSDRLLLREALIEAGADRDRLIGVSSLAEARLALTRTQPDAVLLDLTLPDASGIEAVAVLVAAAPTLPIVVVTGAQSDVLVYAALGAGADEFLYKPDLTPQGISDLILRGRHRRRAHVALPSADASAAPRSPKVPGATAPWSVLETIDAAAVAIDGAGQILAANARWFDMAKASGTDPATVGVGVNYLRVCDRASGPLAEGAAEAAAAIRAVLRGEADQATADYPCPSPGGPQWFTVRVSPLGALGGGAVIIHSDITDLKQAELAVRTEGDPLLRHANEDSLVYARIDDDGTVLDLSTSTAQLLGRSSEEVCGSSVFDHIAPDDHTIVTDAVERVRGLPWGRAWVTVRLVDSSSRLRELEVSITNLVQHPEVAAFVVAGWDASASRRVQVAQRLESRLLMRLPVGLIVTDDEGTIVYWNDQAEVIHGHPASEVLGRRVTELAIGPTDPAILDEMARTVGEVGRWEGYTEGRRADGSTLPVRIAIESAEEPTIGFKGVVTAITDVSEHRQLEEDLIFQSLHDPLTHLANRRLFSDQLDRVLARSTRSSRTVPGVGVLIVDLDGFGAINERMGFEAGDALLRSACHAITETLSPGDLRGRFGGDEFVIGIDGFKDPAELYELAERVLAALDAPLDAGDEEVLIGASIGIGLADGASTAGTLIRRANAALNEAKNEPGRQIVLVGDGEQGAARLERLARTDLARGIAAGEITVLYQPQVDLRTGRLAGFEALARWDHHERGRLGPGHFVPMAERSGLAADLGRAVLSDVCATLAEWRDASPERPPTVAVNVSTIELLDPEFPTLVASIIEAADVDPGWISLELTETALIDSDRAAEALRRLKAVGVGLAIDDFGTGYSSLSRLQRFPLDHLKIDRSFVDGMMTRAEDEVIVSSIITLAQALGLEVVAEGIEQPEQRDRLEAMGADTGQGYLWNKPLERDDARKLVGTTGPMDPSLAARPRHEPEATASSAQVEADTTAIAVLAHEMAQPLTIMGGYASLLSQSNVDPALREEWATEMARAVRRASTILDLSRDVAELDVGSLTLARTSVHTAELIEQALAFLEPEDRVHFTVEGANVTVEGDAARLTAALANLIENSVKHAPTSASRTVRTEHKDATVEIHVADEGPGVPATLVGTIFRRYGRVNRRVRGSGLGLYLARGIARAHGGELTCRTPTGGGADFVLELPLPPDAPPLAP